MTPPPNSPPSASRDGSLLSEDSQHCLSALMDGQAWAVSEATRKWRDEPQARQTWHAYHVIGDVLRSDELASSAAHDQKFLKALRHRMASEPVLMVPSAPRVDSEAPNARAATTRQRWVLPLAAVAGVSGVAAMAVMSGVLVLGRPGALPTAAPALAAASGAGGGAGLVPMARTGTDGVIRDPRLDEYLRAHQAARSGVVAGVPGSALRSVDTVLPQAQPAR